MGRCFAGLSVVNVELTSRCNKNCGMCGRRKLDIEASDMDFKLIQKIAKQLPSGIIVQFHNNGESLLYPRFGDAVRLFKNQIKCLDTNAKLLVEKANEIINNLDTLTISVIQDDIEGDRQYGIVKEFLSIKGDQKPFMVYRLLGNVKDPERWRLLPGVVATRVLHDPMGSFHYEKQVTIPEVGICMDLLTHLVIDRHGDIYPCVRFDPDNRNFLGNANKKKLIDAWDHRKSLIDAHVAGRRNSLMLCRECEYWGCPTSS